MEYVLCAAIAALLVLTVFFVSMSKFEARFFDVLETITDMQETRLATMRYIARITSGFTLPPHLQPQEPEKADEELEAFERLLENPDLRLDTAERDHVIGMWKVVTGRRPASREKVKQYTRALLDRGLSLAG